MGRGFQEHQERLILWKSCNGPCVIRYEATIRSFMAAEGDATLTRLLESYPHGVMGSPKKSGAAPYSAGEEVRVHGRLRSSIGITPDAERALRTARCGYGFTSVINVPKFAASAPGGNCVSGGSGGLMDSVAIQRLPPSSATAAE